MTTEDEATRLLKRADPARLDDSAPGVDAAGYLAALRTRNTTVKYIDTEPIPTPPARHRRWPIIAVAAAAVVAIVVGGLVVVTRNDDPTAVVPAAQPKTVAQPTTTVAQPAAVAQPPVAVTACIEPGDTVDTEPGATVDSAQPDSTADSGTGEDLGVATFRQGWNSVSDPRLAGTYERSWHETDYPLAGGEAGPNIVVITDRIENDEGAWQGSSVWARFPDDVSYYGPLVLVGEGAYDGLTAILGGIEAYGECAVTGYIIDGTIPAPPAPPSAQ